MPLDYTHLKVDQTLLQQNDTYLLVSNINIPISEFENLEQVLDRVKQFIAQDYNNVQNIFYQVCATYNLRNTDTGEIRHWSGSFNPKGNRLNVLRQFCQYSVQTFAQQVSLACQPANVYSCLQFFHVETVWVFHELTSAIISVQAQIAPTHYTVEHKGLLNRRYGKLQRVHLTFHLP